MAASVLFDGDRLLEYLAEVDSKLAEGGNRLTVYAVGPYYLLATKLIAGRDSDIDDAAILAADVGAITAEELMSLL